MMIQRRGALDFSIVEFLKPPTVHSRSSRNFICVRSHNPIKFKLLRTMMNMMMMSNAVASKAYFEKAECPICYDALSNEAVATFCNSSGVTTCSHKCHVRCAASIAAPCRCPVCSTVFSQAVPVPVMTVDARAWFDFIDTDRDGALKYEEIIDGLKSQLVLDWQRLEADVDKLWRTWDKDSNGKISFAEFADPKTGVAVYLSSHYPNRPRPPPPDITQSKVAWFDYWDEDGSGTLDKEEVARALIKTFRLINIDHRVVREMLDNIWFMFDSDSSGKIDKKEFSAYDGLGDTITAQLASGR